MEVILKQDIKNLGYADDVVKVRPGYGRNYLIPRGMAVLASETNKKIHNEVIKQRSHKVAKVRGDAEKLASALEGVTLSISAKVGENGKLFGSVTSQQLMDKLKSMGYSIDKKQIVMPEDHIKKIGNYTAEVIVHRDIRAKLNFEVAEAFIISKTTQTSHSQWPIQEMFQSARYCATTANCARLSNGNTAHRAT